ncbi:NAD(P)H-dependent oxidoreductase [Eikenella sp. S3360]|uniref:NAD(P)H-dependent oxidoreductase n=1 Tax=Eikenella glucosivorans TaxID=2766967 RepID=A0ABS0NBP9_9NEIS|nr:NAD(P)H-dependent oxidoreductase [Eikenella glucosivorans]MBH5329695.1 NAD(P)H-dependent oxidoreductase [Eikenella glucosivorans]
MKNVLIVSGHPDLQNSIANAEILAEVAKALPEAEIRKLDALYPERRFNIEAEQSALLKADVIVFQFPFSWYSVPGLMKLWIDEVFVHGFAHGSNAKLAGKKLIISFTTGAPAAVYQRDGFFKHTVEDYLPQFETTATLCNLDYQGAIYTNGIGYTSRDNEEAINAQKQEARQHAARLIAKIKEIAV